MKRWAAVLVLALACILPASAAAKRADVTFKTIEVGDPGNSSVAIVPFTDAIYETCEDAPAGTTDCISVGDVDDVYGIGQLEVTVKQWVAFLNTVDPEGHQPPPPLLPYSEREPLAQVRPDQQGLLGSR